MAVIPQPEGVDFQRWAAACYDTLPLTFPMPLPEDQWVLWASAAVAAFQVAGYQVPVPDGFTDWRAWAEEFLLVYPQTGL